MNTCADRDSSMLVFCSWWSEGSGEEVKGSDVVTREVDMEAADTLIDQASTRAWDREKKALPQFVKAFDAFKDPDDWGILKLETVPWSEVSEK